jgi:hypothetical protein
MAGAAPIPDNTSVFFPFHFRKRRFLNSDSKITKMELYIYLVIESLKTLLIMDTLIKNTNPVPECDNDATTLTNINARTILTNFDVGLIKADTDRLSTAISANADPKVRNIMTATTFPIKDIKEMINDHPDSKFIRVYNGCTSDDKFVTYLVALDASLNVFPDTKSSQSCCHCRPCRLDRIVNP